MLFSLGSSKRVSSSKLSASISASSSCLPSHSYSRYTHHGESSSSSSLYHDIHTHSTNTTNTTSNTNFDSEAYDDFEYDERIGNTTFYSANPNAGEDDSIISDSDDSLGIGLDLDDPDPTVRANFGFGARYTQTRAPYNLSISTKTTRNMTVNYSNPSNPSDGFHYDDSTSFEGAGTPETPGSPGSLLWMDPLDERHMVDLES